MSAARHSRMLWTGMALLALAVATGTGTSHLQLIIVGLGCVALVPLMGWLGHLSLLPLAAAGTGAISAAFVLSAHQAVPVVLAAAVLTGALTGAAVMVASTGDAPLDSYVSVVAAVAVWGLVLPAVTVTASSEVVLFGVDLSSDRSLALFAVVLLAAVTWATVQVGASPLARGALVGAADPATAGRFGVDVRRTRLQVGLLSGAVAGCIGLLLTLDAQTLPTSGVFAPAVGLIWLGAALLGGRTRVGGALLGAVVVGGLAPALGLAPPAAAGIALLLVALAGGDSPAALLLRRRTA